MLYSLRACSQAVRKPVWHMPLLCIQWKTPDDEQRNCPKHIEFYSKNKFEKLVHLDGFIIRIYHDARSPERQLHVTCFKFYVKMARWWFNDGNLLSIGWIIKYYCIWLTHIYIYTSYCFFNSIWQLDVLYKNWIIYCFP